MKHFFLLIFLFLIFGSLSAQGKFTHADTLRGMLRPERTCFDVTFYELNLSIDRPTKSIKGKCGIQFDVLEDFQTMQIDLFANLLVDEIHIGSQICEWQREENAIWVTLPATLEKGSKNEIVVGYHGKPIEAKMPPWDGGFVWKEDKNGKPWIGVACEGTGASSWWPLKDHLSDEPDSMHINLHLASKDLDDLMAVANGQFRGMEAHPEGGNIWKWAVTYPINSYNVTLNIADYTHIHETFTNASGEHDMDYYVLKYNEDAAREHFKQVGPMMECFEKHFGEYPFWRDGYALVETSYWGMEHQGAVAYGNNYKNNGFGWDFIIIHETGHEWWGNHVSCSDHAELWIHESFCTYAEAVYMECNQGYDQMIKYLRTQRRGILNKTPMVGPLNVNYESWGDSDMYNKGTWMLHTLRTLIGNDELWFSILKDLQSEFSNQQIHTKDITSYIEKRSGMDLTRFWQQYLYHPKIPKLEYKLKKKGKNTQITYRWVDVIEGFDMQIGIKLGKNDYKILHPTQNWQDLKIEMAPENFKVDRDKYYVFTKNLSKKK